MKKFISQVILFCGVCFFFVLIIFFKIDGYTDPFYLRFTSPKQKNLILGTSRAAQGIIPQKLDSILDKKFYNYAFTVAHSPYGKIYLESVKKKIIRSQNTDNIFILTVDPWAISSVTEDPNDEDNFRENSLALATTTIVNMKPNFEYLYNSFDGHFNKILSNKSNNFLHDDGWLEVSPPMDSISLVKREAITIKNYKEKHLLQYKFSPLRLEYLKKIVVYLNDFGKVYLIRLPLHSKMKAIESEFMDDFNQKIEELAWLTQGYFDMTELNEKYIYTDANHLYKESSKQVTVEIAKWVKNNL